VEREGPQIVRELQRIEGVEVFSPWAQGGRRVLRERPGQALLSIQVRRSFNEIFDETTPAVEQVLERYERGGLDTELTGSAPLMRAINETSLEALDKGELIALPVLFVMLLLIFRSPLAALVPAFSGLVVIRIGTALMGAIGTRVEIDALALSMVAMIGLALGVDYSLLMVSRFREELGNGRSVPDAVEETTARAGRTVLFAGSALAIGMLCALLISPGALLVSSSLGLIVATLLSVVVALLAMPALLAVLGTNVNRFQIGGARTASPWVAIAERALRRPGAAAFFTLLPLILLSAPAIALDTGPPNIANLPPDNPERLSFERFERLRGGGFAAPFEVDFVTRGPMTTTERLREIDRFQERVSRLPGVESVLGPAVLLRTTQQLRRLTTGALDAGAPLGRLERGLRAAEGGTVQLRDGLAAGAEGASLLVTGIEQLAGGSGQLAAGAERAAPASRRLADGVEQTSRGAGRLARVIGRAAPGVDRLQTNVEVLRDSLNDASRTASSQLIDPLDDAQSSVQSALRDLSETTLTPAAAADPSVQRARRAVSDALTTLGDVALNLSTATTTQDANAIATRALARGVARLRRGFLQLADGSSRLADGIGRTADGTDRLAAGTNQLSRGLAQLDVGVRTLLDGPGGGSGARALADGLQAAVGGTTDLARGTGRILDGVVRVRAQADRQQARLRRGGTDTDRAIGSGYFVLAAIEGADPQVQTNTGFVANVKD
ncbi:MAG TPA: MMPL family transporter, partial [Conexibacter sp.]|nr:MMPL family transporter [Conexibacter sp.]